MPVSTLQHIAAADGFRGLGLSRRDAAWAIKALRDDALPLFAAADDRAGILRPEATEPTDARHDGRARGRVGLSEHGPEPSSASSRVPARELAGAWLRALPVHTLGAER